jgi:hypothetical protein
MKTLYGFLLSLVVLLQPEAAYAACTSPAGSEGAVEFVVTENRYVYCDGSAWQPLIPNAPSTIIGKTPGGNATLDWDTTEDYCGISGMSIFQQNVGLAGTYEYLLCIIVN